MTARINPPGDRKLESEHMPWLQPVTLEGPYARLEPLSHDHRDALVEAVKDGELWKLWYTFVPAPGRAPAWKG
jgi:hypothetical protein